MNQEYVTMATREGFNRALRHFGHTLSTNDAFEKGTSFGDKLVSAYESGSITEDQLLPILNAILVSKFKASYLSFHLEKKFTDFKEFNELVADWSALDIVLVYHSPALGICVINPKNLKHLENAQDFLSGHLLVAYAYTRKKAEDGAKKKLADDCVEAIAKWLRGDKIENSDELFASFVDKTSAPAAAPAPAPAPQPAAPAAGQAASAPKPAPAPGGKKRATPKYSVQVSNELFHNGNVEAWKNIIESYQTSFPGNQVIVFYEGELIQDLNSLFKWGKVKHAGLIMIQVIGTNIKGISKLQKYLYEGASPRYEAFMKHDVNKALKLF